MFVAQRHTLGRVAVRRPHSSRAIRCTASKIPTVHDVAQQALEAAYRPLIDVLERIDKKLDKIEKNMHKTTYVETTGGQVIKKVAPVDIDLS